MWFALLSQLLSYLITNVPKHFHFLKMNHKIMLKPAAICLHVPDVAFCVILA